LSPPTPPLRPSPPSWRASSAPIRAVAGTTRWNAKPCAPSTTGSAPPPAPRPTPPPPAAAAALAALQMLEPAPQAAVLGRSERLDMASAALLNGITSHTFDFDDTHLKTIIYHA